MTVFWGIIDTTILGLTILALAVLYAEIDRAISQHRRRKHAHARRGYIR